MVHVTLLAPPENVPSRGGEELLHVPCPKWVDLQATTEDELRRVAARFGLHRLAIEDCLHLDQRPKLEEYPGHLFVVLQSYSAGADPCDLTLHEVHLFIGPDWLLTVHALPSDGIVTVEQRLRDEPQVVQRGVDFIAYLVMDALVDQNFPIFDAFQDEVDRLEGEVFERPQQAQLQRLFALKRSLTQIRRVLSPQRDVVGMLSRRGLAHIQDRTTLYFRDVYDHLIRLYEQVEATRDVLGNMVEAYLSMVANRTNDITKQLTIFATIFLPLSFVSGFFGQNFEVLSRPEFFHLMLALTALIPLVLGFWFRVKRWT